MTTYERNQWMFIGSDMKKSTYENSKKIHERITGINRTITSSYKNKLQEPNSMLLDEDMLKKIFNKKYKRYVPAILKIPDTMDKTELLAKITDFMDQPIENSLIVFSGHAQEVTGDWVFEFKNNEGMIYQGKVTFNEIHQIWKKRNESQRHLLMVIDSSYSENWITKLKICGDNSISIQTSCKKSEKASEDQKVGSYFIYNWSKIIGNLSHEQVFIPMLNPQTPTFYGNFFYLEQNFGLQLKFESWIDMRKALNNSHFGDWPRLSKKENKYIRDFGMQNNQVNNTSFDKGRNPLDTMQNNPNYHGMKPSLNKPHVHEKIDETNFCCNKSSIIANKFQTEKTLNLDPIEPLLVTRPFGQSILDADKKLSQSVHKGYQTQRIGSRNNSMDKSRIDQMIIENEVCNKEAGEVYVGDYDENGVKNGKGTILNKEGKVIFEGQFEKNLRNGRGNVYDPEGYKIFEGLYSDNLKNGNGTIFNKNQVRVFEGRFEDDFKNGDGREFYDSGVLKFEGCYLNDKRIGDGIEYHENKTPKIRGTWQDGLLHGEKVYIQSENGQIEYKGEYANGEKTGRGRVFYENGNLQYEGEFLDGLFHGEGTFWDENKQLVHEGFWDYGNFIMDSSYEEGNEDENVKIDEESQDKNNDANVLFGTNDLEATDVQEKNAKGYEYHIKQTITSKPNLLTSQDKSPLNQSIQPKHLTESADPTLFMSHNDVHLNKSSEPKDLEEFIAPNPKMNNNEMPLNQNKKHTISRQSIRVVKKTGNRKSQPKFSATKLKPEQEEKLNTSSISMTQPQGRNEIINPGNIYQVIRIESSYNLPSNKLSVLAYENNSETQDPIKNGVVIRKKSDIVSLVINQTDLQNSIVFSKTNEKKGNLTISQLEKSKDNIVHKETLQYSTLSYKQQIKNLMKSPQNLTVQDLTSSLVIMNPKHPALKKIEANEEVVRTQILDKQEIKIKHIQVDQIKGKKIEDEFEKVDKLNPRSPVAIVKTARAEMNKHELGKGGIFKASVHV